MATTSWRRTQIFAAVFATYGTAPEWMLARLPNVPVQIRWRWKEDNIKSTLLESNPTANPAPDKEDTPERTDAMSADGSPSSNDRLVDEEEEEYAEEDAADGQDDDAEMGEDGEDDRAGPEALAPGMSRYKMQHGAHREYQVPESMILHEAKSGMRVESGEHLGNMVASRAPKNWDGLKWTHVHIVGGKSKTTGEQEQAPFVCFMPPGDMAEETDDVDWMRPIPAKVMEHYQPQWKAEIKEKYDDERLKRELQKYKPVLKWNESMLSGQRIDPKNFGIGRGGFMLIKKKLKSIRVAPEVVPRNAPKSDGGQQTKLTSAIAKAPPLSKKGQGSSSMHDMESVASDATSMVEARTIRIGPVTTTSTFVLDGVVYATTLS